MAATPQPAESSPSGEAQPTSNHCVLTTDGTLLDVYRRADDSFVVVVTPPGAPRTLAYASSIDVSADAAAHLVRTLCDMGVRRLPDARIGPALDLTTGDTIGARS